jgi:hypothetical protein
MTNRPTAKFEPEERKAARKRFLTMNILKKSKDDLVFVRSEGTDSTPPTPTSPPATPTPDHIPTTTLTPTVTPTVTPALPPTPTVPTTPVSKL